MASRVRVPFDTRVSVDLQLTPHPAFNIHMPPGVDNYPHSSAPTRPPSRVSQRSDMHPDRPLQSAALRFILVN